jgi:hypothetical protein
MYLTCCMLTIYPISSVRLSGLAHLELDKQSRILEDTYTLIGLPPYLAGQRSSTSLRGGFLKRGYLNRAFFLPTGRR